MESKARQPVNPEVFELLFNYRSHGGIVACAASIIDLISSMFPYSIDKLQREASMVEGPKPRVFRDNVVHWEMFLCDSDSGYVIFFCKLYDVLYLPTAILASILVRVRSL